MTPDLLAQAISQWTSLTAGMKSLLSVAVISSVVSFGSWTWFLLAKTSSTPKPPEQILNTHIEVTANFYAAGSIVEVTGPPRAEWSKRVDAQGRTWYSHVDNQPYDLGTATVKTVAIADKRGVIDVRFRIINILEGAFWDVRSETVLRDSDGNPIELDAIFSSGRFRQRFHDSDAVVCVGLASRLPTQSSEYNQKLATGRARSLALAVWNEGSFGGSYHGKGLGDIYWKLIYQLPLGASLTNTEIGDPEEPLQRSAIIIGVELRDKKQPIADVIPDILAPDVSATVDLSNYDWSRTALEHLSSFSHSERPTFPKSRDGLAD